MMMDKSIHKNQGYYSLILPESHIFAILSFFPDEEFRILPHLLSDDFDQYSRDPHRCEE